MMPADPGQPPLTATPATAAVAKTSTQYVGFVLADQEYAFRIDHIREIVIPERVTRLPQVASYVEGCSNLRGTIIPMINLRVLLGLEAKPRDAQTRTIVAQVGKKIVGCTVDDVTQVLRISSDQIQSASTVLGTGQASYISGLAKVDTRLIILLEIEQLLDISNLEYIHQLALEDGHSRLSGTSTTENQ
jgi:purine-binding chemotaxis protein CheW